MRALITAEPAVLRRLVFVVATLICAPATVQAQTATLTWDPSPDPAVVGYTVHVGINPGVYGQTFDVSGASNTTFTFAQAIPGQRYHFAVSAYDAQNLSSSFSNVVSWKINVGPTLAQPANQTSTVGAAASLQLTATDDGDPLTFTAVGLPSGLSLNRTTGLIGGTPTTLGTFTVTVTVSDGLIPASRVFTWTVANPPPMSLTQLSGSRPSPQLANTSVTFTAAATGGRAPYQFKYLMSSGGATTTVRTWATTAQYTWTPTQAGTYSITVWVRSNGQTADVAEATRTVSYTITGPFALTALTSSVTSPQQVGTPITFAPVAAGGLGPYQFKWWIYDGTTWSVARDWAPGTFTWMPAVPNSNYRVTVWGRPANIPLDISAYTASLSYRINAGASTGPLTITSLTSNVPSPRPTGSAVTFTTAVSGGIGPHQFKWWLYNGSTWSTLQDWSGSNTYTWTPTQASPNYRITVWVRNVTTTANASDADATMMYTITGAAASAPLTINGLTSNVASPQVAGTPVTFTAAASGGTAPYQYKWWLYDGSSWMVLQGWTGSNTYTWTPTQSGNNYQIGAWVRNATTTADANDASRTVPFAVTAAAGGPAPLTMTSFTSSLPSPRVVGTPVTFTAAATGGAAPYQYKFLVYDGSTWTVTRAWSGSNTYTWTPLQANASYRVAVWVRNSTTLADVSDANTSVAYPITTVATGGALRILSLTSDRPSPQMSSTAVTFTAAVAGGSAPYQFKWWLFNGSTWTVLQNWSGNSSYTWTPTQPATNYGIGVWVRNATATADASDASVWVPYVINGASSAPLTVTSFTSNLSPPRVTGASITFVASASGGTSPYEFKFLLHNGVTWTLARDWSASNTYTWTPLQANAYYRVAVWVRNAGTVADVADASTSMPYPIAAPAAGGPLTLIALNSNVSGPQVAGPSITFTAPVSGGKPPYQFKWWLFDGTTWTVIQNWSGSSTYTWTPGQANANYRVGVWVKQASEPGDVNEASLWVPYVITP